MNKRILIRGGVVVNASGRERCDVLVEGERIEILAAPGQLDDLDAEVIDAEGCLVLPGGVDVHTHFDGVYMGAPNSDDFETGGRAALAGGTTTHIDMCFQRKAGSLEDAAEAWHAKARGRALCDYALHLVVCDLSPSVRDEMFRLASAGYPSFKFFTVGEAAISEADLLDAFAVCAAAGGVAMVHAEDRALVDRATRALLADGRTDPAWFPTSRPAAAEAAAVVRVLTYARVTGAALHVAHVTCNDALQAITSAKAAGQDVSAETCPHYLALTDAVFRGADPAAFVCGPPLRTDEDRGALWAALGNGGLSLVSSDHGPIDMAHRRRLGTSFATVPHGLGTGQFIRPLLWTEGVLTGRIDAERMVELTATAPARRFGLERKGRIAVGADADLVVWDPSVRWEADEHTCQSAADYRVLDGWRFAGEARRTLRRGEVVWAEGLLLGRPGGGRFVPRPPGGEVG